MLDYKEGGGRLCSVERSFRRGPLSVRTCYLLLVASSMWKLGLGCSEGPFKGPFTPSKGR
jgi:hypothetical protein